MGSAVEFESKATADHFRSQYPDAICPDDDARLKTVQFTADAPDRVLEEAERAAFEEGQERASGAGQVPLDDYERDELDFSKEGVNVPKAQAVKAIALDSGVDDWLSHFDPTLTVDEHRNLVQRAGAKSGGKALDAEESGLEKAGRAARSAQASECDHAEGHCKHGDPGACEFLQEECGFEESQVERILNDDTISESGDLPGPIFGAFNGLWTQYRAGLGEAKRAAAAINEIRSQYGQNHLEFEELGDREITREDLT